MPEALAQVLEGVAVPQRLEIDVCRALDRPTKVELRADPAADATDAGLGTLVGEFSLFNEWYLIDSYWEGTFIERIAPGAFKRTINNRSGQSPVRVLLEHGFDPTVADKPLGVPTVLEERITGAYAETPLFDTSYNRDLAPALRGGAYGQSFRFQVLIDEWVEPGSEGWVDTGIPAYANLPQRTIREVRLIEFGPTIFPASPSTNATTGMRSELRSSTDHFYDQLAKRDSGRFDAAVRSVSALRAPVSTRSAQPAEPQDIEPEPTPAEPETGTTPDSTTEDSPNEHSTDPTEGTPADAGDAERHSTDSPATHSEDPTNTPSSRKDKTMAEPMTVEERAARQSEIRARLAEIDNEFSGGALPEETRSEWDGLLAELNEHDVAIADQERRREQLRAIAGSDDATEPGVGRSRETLARTAGAQSSRFGAPGVTRRPENIFDLAEVRQRARSIDELPALYRDNAMRAVEQARFPGAEDRSAAQEKATRLLDTVDDANASLARRILITGAPTYDRAFGKAIAAMSTNGLTAEEQRALSLGVDAEGGFAVPFQLDPTIMLTSDGVIDPLRQISRVEQITGKEWQGVTSAGVTVSRKAEKAESDDNSPSLGQKVVRTSRVDGFIPFTVEVEQDWAQMRAELTALLAEGKADEEADSFITGDGSANAGTGVEPEGILTGATVVFETAGTALTRGDLYGFKGALGARFRARGTFLAEGSFFDQVRGLDEDGDVWSQLANDNTPRLLGRPTAEGSAMPVFATAAGTKVAIFGDFSKFLIVDRVGMNVELVPHLFGANRRPVGERGIWAWWRNGSKVLVPNAFRVLQIKTA